MQTFITCREFLSSTQNNQILPNSPEKALYPRGLGSGNAEQQQSFAFVNKLWRKIHAAVRSEPFSWDISHMEYQFLFLHRVSTWRFLCFRTGRKTLQQFHELKGSQQAREDKIPGIRCFSWFSYIYFSWLKKHLPSSHSVKSPIHRNS